MVALIGALIWCCARLIVFRAAPWELPQHRQILGMAIGLNALTSGLLQLVSPVDHFVGRVGFYLVFTLGISLFYVRIRGLGERWQLTAAALFGADALITLVALPLYAWGAHVARSGEPLGPDYYLLLMGLILWGATVAANIYRHALNIAWPVAIAISFATTLLMIFSSAAVFGDA